MIKITDKSSHSEVYKDFCYNYESSTSAEVKIIKKINCIFYTENILKKVVILWIKTITSYEKKAK